MEINNKIQEYIGEFKNMIKDSWTYGRFTNDEKIRWDDLVNSNRIINAINDGRIGKQRVWDYLNSVYYGFLIGIGYDNYEWRES